MFTSFGTLNDAGQILYRINKFFIIFNPFFYDLDDPLVFRFNILIVVIFDLIVCPVKAFEAFPKSLDIIGKMSFDDRICFIAFVLDLPKKIVETAEFIASGNRKTIGFDSCFI